MRLTQYLNEITEPTVRYTLENLKKGFERLGKTIQMKKLYEMDDKQAVKLLAKEFADIGVKIVLGKKAGGVRKYVGHGEFGGDYGKGLIVNIEMQPGFSKVFRRFAKEKSMKNFTNHVKNPIFREMLEVISHEIMHADQFLNSKGSAFDPDLIGIEDTYNGNMEDYLKNPLEIEPYAQQAAIDTIRKGHSFFVFLFKSYFPKNSPVLKKFLKKFIYYLELLKTQGDIQPYDKK